MNGVPCNDNYYMDWRCQASLVLLDNCYIDWLFHVYDLLILQVNVSISSRDSYCVDIVLRCIAIASDGLEPHELNDGGILGTILASGFKGRNFIK